MKKIGLLFSLIIVFCIALYSCGGDNPLAPTVTLNKTSGSTISVSQKLVLTFSKSMDKTKLELAGTMAALSDGGVWSKDKLDNDTLTISPTTTWDASAPGTLTVAAEDTDKKALADQSLTYNFKLTFTNYQAASVVIGQPDFTSSASATTASGISGVYSSPSVENGKLAIGEYNNSRTLIFNTIPTTNGKAADVVVGEPDFTTSSGGTTSSDTYGNETSVISDGKLFIQEYSNNRVLIFNSVPTSNHAAANVVVGQPDFISSGTGCTSTSLNDPEGTFVGAGKLIVTDSNNNRVLIWNSIPTTNGKAADLVLGQGDFTHCTANDANQDNSSDTTSSAKTLNYPAGAWTDGTKLVVLDGSNNRVLIWNTFPTTNFQKADVVLGQGDFVHNQYNDDNQDGTSDATPTARTFYFPYLGVYSNGTQLFVPDADNYRVLVWNTFPTTNFQKADVVLGEPDFVSNAGGVTNKLMSYPVGVTLAGDKLLVSDEGNNRVLVFKGE